MTTNGHGGVQGSPGGNGLARRKSIQARWDNLTIATREIREALVVELLDLPDAEFDEVLDVGLRADDEETRRLAVEISSILPDHHGVLAALDDPEPSVRLAAVAALATRRPDSAPTGLHLALRDACPHVRSMAIRAMAVIDAPLGWTAADEALDDPVDIVRETAALTLESLARNLPVDVAAGDPVAARTPMPSAVRPILSVLIPVYNERPTLDEALTRLMASSLPAATEVILVDDGSTDGSREIAARWADEVDTIRAVFHERNGGKGAALRTALNHATGQFVCILDADLEYNPDNIADALRPLISGQARAVYGVRSFGGHAAHSFWYVVGNRTLTTLTNVIYNQYVRDMMTCIKAMRLEDFRRLDLRSNGFAIEAEITAKLMRLGVRVHEVPVDYKARSHEQGKKIRPSDALRVLAVLLRQRVRSPRGFAPAVVAGPRPTPESTPFGRSTADRVPGSPAELAGLAIDKPSAVPA